MQIASPSLNLTINRGHGQKFWCEQVQLGGNTIGMPPHYCYKYFNELTLSAPALQSYENHHNHV